MGKRITPESIHSNTPRELVDALRDVGYKERTLARQLGVNILYVSQLLKYGIEPTDKTTKGQAVREKLFLPKKKPKPPPKYDRPAWLYKWYRLPVSERHSVMQAHIEER